MQLDFSSNLLNQGPGKARSIWSAGKNHLVMFLRINDFELGRISPQNREKQTSQCRIAGDTLYGRNAQSCWLTDSGDTAVAVFKK